ncbi:MAG: hypothetical protein ACI4PW_06970 [Alphaproteobacteria bacterium]|jgi:Tfp pilus assembly protein PilV
MQGWQEKLKDALLLSDEDVALVFKGDFKTLLTQNKEGALRVLSTYGIFLAALLMFLILFSVFGGMCKLVLILLAFGVLGALAFMLKRDGVIRMTQIPAFSYFLMFMLAAVTLAMFSDISKMGSGGSKFLLLLVLGGLGGGFYSLRPKALEKGWSNIQMVLVALLISSFILSFQAAFIQMSIDSTLEHVRYASEMQRQKQADEIRRNSMSAPQKACTSDEECRRMNTKKNEYYAEHEEIAMETCENAVAKEITSRFEWTVSPKEYKFSSYQVDVLEDLITLRGDRAELIEDGGNRRPITYVCRFNTKTKTTDVVLNK